MVNRKEIEVERFIDHIKETWDLTILEQTLLDNVLTEVQKRQSTRLGMMAESFVECEWDNVLDLIPENNKNWWAQSNGYVTEDDCDCEEEALENFSDEEIREEYFDRFKDIRRLDIVTRSQLEELTSKFLSADFATRELMLNFKYEIRFKEDLGDIK